jgi:hypothetical protein
MLLHNQDESTAKFSTLEAAACVLWYLRCYETKQHNLKLITLARQLGNLGAVS